MRYLWILLVALALVSCGKTEQKRRTMGYKGEAKNNPFLAAQRYLEKEGDTVQLEHGIGHFDDKTSTIFIPPSSVNTVGRAKRLLKWVEKGGHLILMLDGGRLGGNDFVKSPSSITSASSLFERPGLDYLLGELGVTRVSWRHKPTDTTIDVAEMSRDEWEEIDESERVLLDSEKTEIVIEGESFTIHHWGSEGFKVKTLGDEDFADVQDGEKHRVVSVKYHLGRVSCLSDARPFRNRYIGYGDHVRFLNALILKSHTGPILFTSGDGDGLFSLLWLHFKWAVIASFVAVFFWLWRHLPRFGPELDVGRGELRDFSGHVRGIGRFFWRQKRDDTMLSALRVRVNRKMSHHVGAPDGGLFDQLSAQSGLSVEAVIEAMTRENVREPGVMVRVTKNLQTILRTL